MDRKKGKPGSARGKRPRMSDSRLARQKRWNER